MFDVWTSYTIDLFGSKESIKKAGIILAKILQDESIVGSKHIVIRDTNRFVWVDDISQIAKAIANSSPDLTSFTISGRVDNSSSSNAYMDFLIEYKNHTLHSSGFIRIVPQIIVLSVIPQRLCIR